MNLDEDPLAGTPPRSRHGVPVASRPRKTTSKAPPPIANAAPAESTSTPSPQDIRNTERQLRNMEDLVANAVTARTQLIQSLMDPRRNINHDCGYPETMDVQVYQQMVDRNPFAHRALEVLPREAFQSSFSVFETEKKVRGAEKSGGKKGKGPLDDEDDDEEDTDETVVNFAPFEKGEKPEEVEEESDEEIDEDSGETEGTPFEKDVDSLDGQIRGVKSWFKDEDGSVVQDAMMQAAIRAGLGSYGVIVIGLNDGVEDLSLPARGVEEMGSIPKKVRKKDDPPEDDTEKVTTNSYTPYSIKFSESVNNVITVNAEGEKVETPGKREITFLNVLDEGSAPVSAWEDNWASPRHGQPVSYNISFDGPWDRQFNSLSGAPSVTRNVHWTRVVHIRGRNRTSSKVASQPELQPIYNNLYNLDKVFGASGEGYWKSGFPGVILSTHPELGGNVKVDRADLKNQWEHFENSLSRVLYLMGMEATTIAPAVVDPTPFIEQNVQAICIKLAIPKRKFMGSERGELSSTEDEGDWNDKLSAYQRTYLVPEVIVPFYDRLIMLGVLSQPKQYHVEFEPVDAQSQKEKADVANVYTTAMATYVSGNVASLIGEEDYLVEVCGFDEAKVKIWVERATAQLEQDELDQQDLADEWGMEPVAPEGFEKPMDQQLLEKVNGRGSPFPPKPKPKTGVPK